MKTKFVITSGFLVLMVCGPLFAHHGNGEFDTTKLVSLQAKVTEFAWQNPHSIVYFDVKNDKGELIHWSGETIAPSTLHRLGWTRDSIKPGDQVTVVFHPSKHGEPVAYLQKVILGDGTVLIASLGSAKPF